jgi:hypothetical protein
MFVSGFKGLGKSFLVSQLDLPQNIVFVDMEDKGEGIDTQLNFGLYRALVQEADGDPQTEFNLFKKLIEELPQDQYTVMVIDNISPLEIAMQAEGMRTPDFYANRYALNATNIKTGKFGGAKAVANAMIDEICSKIHSKGIRLIGITSHVSDRWGVGGKIPNKYNPKGQARWNNLSILTLLLVPGDKPPVPDGVVWKEQLGSIEIDRDPTPEQLDAMMRGEAGHKIQRRLPARIPQCTMQKIRWYLRNPVDWNNLADDEKMRPNEMDPFDDKLSNEQLGYMKMAAELEAKREREEEQLLQMFENQKELEQINGHVKLLEGYDGALTPVAIKNYLAEKGEVVTMPIAAKLMQEFRKSLD